MQPKTAAIRGTAITQAVLEQFGGDEGTLELAATEDLVINLSREYRFFHWHVEFPHIFRVGNGATDIDPATGWSGGFSCVIGNPPWERVKPQEREFFAARSPAIATAPNAAARKRLIAALADSTSPAERVLNAEFRAEQRRSAGWSHLLRESGRYPLTGRGDINTYAVFAETARTTIAPHGRLGIIIPTGIATDKTTAPFFRDLIAQHRLASLFDFITNPEIWQEIGHGKIRFSLLTVAGRHRAIGEPEFAALVKRPSDLPPKGSRIQVPAEDLLLVNPNTGTCPMFQTRRDAEITIGIYKRVPILWRHDPEENPWGLSFMAMFHMANDSGLFHTRDSLEADGWHLVGNAFVRGNARMLPLYEAKLMHHFDHRLATYDKRPEGSQDSELPRLDLDEKNDPSRSPMPYYWVDKAEVDARLTGRGWDKGWLLGWRRFGPSGNERSMINAIIPQVAVGDSIFLQRAVANPGACAALAASLSSFVLDYVARQKITGANLSYFLVEQFPVLPPAAYMAPVGWLSGYELDGWIRQRVLELSYTAYDLEPFAADLGDDGPPFRWDEERRFVMRAELDAAFFHLYGIERDDVDYIMETFPIVKRKDEQRYGSFRTKELILDVYDAMAEAMRTGVPYQTILDPPPGHGPRHPERDVLRGDDLG